MIAAQDGDESHLQFLLHGVAAALAAGDRASALRQADRARRLAPNEAAIALLHGRLLLEAGRPADARAALQKSLSLGPDPDTTAWLADALSAAGEGHRAAERVEAGLRRFAVVPQGLLAASAGRLAAEMRPAGSPGGWVGVAPTLDLVGEIVGIAGTATLEITDGDGSVVARERLRARGPEDRAAFRIASWTAPRQLLTARVDGAALLGSGFFYRPDFDLDGRATVEEARIGGWARLGWCPSALGEIVVEDERGARIVLASEAVPEKPGRRRFDVMPRERGLSGARILVSARLPDGGLEPFPDAPLLLEAPTFDAPEAALPRPGARRSRVLRRPPIDVVIPVYLGYDETLACLDSVIATVGVGAAGGRARIVVVDDASPDRALAAALDRRAAAGSITLLRNERNAGFPASANRGLALDGSRDVVLLNADTIVYGDWLERLQGAAYGAPDIGTATPLSNAGSIASYPADDGASAEADPEDALPEDAMPEDAMPEDAMPTGAALDGLAASLGPGRAVELPTGVGFCLYLRRDCLAQTGFFDAATFAQGYGEENDLCLRASARGWRHVLAADVYVSHVGGRSFGRRRAALMERNRRLLNLRYPHYDGMVVAFIAADPVRPVRRNLDEARLLARPGPTALLVAPAVSGGVERFVRERCRAWREAGVAALVARPDPAHPGRCVLTLDEGGGGSYRDLVYELPREEAALGALLAGLQLAAIELHHFLGHEARAIETVTALGLSYDVYIHDNSWICPRLTLLGGDGSYCGEPELAGCEACVRTHGSSLEETLSVAALRARSGRWLAAAHRVVAPSQDAAARLSRHFPGLAPVILAWEPAPARARSSEKTASVSGRPLRVAVIGAIGRQKGYDVVLACARDAARRALPLEFVVIGYTEDDRKLFDTGKVFVTGRYEEGEIDDLLRREEPDLAFFASVTPETWCYALTPALRAGLPIVAFDLGAIPERLRAAGSGRVVPVTTRPERLNDLLLSEAAAAKSKAAPDAEAGGLDAPAAPPPSAETEGDTLSASARLMTIPEGLYAFRVRAGAPARSAAKAGIALPSVAVGLAPGQPLDTVDFLHGPRNVGHWLCEPGDMLVARISRRPATLLLTSLRAPGGAALAIDIERLDNRGVGEKADDAGDLWGRPPIVTLPPAPKPPAAPHGPAVQNPASVVAALPEPPGLPREITVHVRRRGDRTFADPAWAGYIGEGMWIEAFSVRPLDGPGGDQIEYKGLTATGYETPWLGNNAPCGTRGMATPLLGFAVRAKPGPAAEAYDVEYRGAFLSGALSEPHRNGAPCRSPMPDDPLEAIELRILRRLPPEAAPSAIAPAAIMPTAMMPSGGAAARQRRRK